MLIGSFGGLEVGGVDTSSSASKPRLRSLTPSAEKLRVSTLQHQQQAKVVANGNESFKDQVHLIISFTFCLEEPPIITSVDDV